MEKPSLCETCIHLNHVQGELSDLRRCTVGGYMTPLRQKVYKCTDYHRRNAMTMHVMERIAYIPDEGGVWKKPDRKAGFFYEDVE